MIFFGKDVNVDRMTIRIKDEGWDGMLVYLFLGNVKCRVRPVDDLRP